MKKILFPLLLACCLPLSAEDCAKSSDACSAGSKSSSPFLAASAQPAKTAAAPVVPAKKTAPVAQPAVPARTDSAADVIPAPEKEGAGKLSSPLWLLLVGGGLAGLYFYLGGKKKKGKRL